MNPSLMLIIKNVLFVKKDLHVTEEHLKELVNALVNNWERESIDCYFVAPGEKNKYGGISMKPTFMIKSDDTLCPRININTYQDLYWATQIFAHELGHNLNME